MAEEGDCTPTDQTNVYVGNIAFSTTDESLSTLFADMSVESCEVIKTRTGRSRGFGIVKFSSVEEANSAITKHDQTDFEGRKLYLKVDRKPAPKLNTSTNVVPTNVYLGNLPFAATSESLSEIFADVPGFKSATVSMDRRNERSRGYAILCFETADDAQAAIQQLDQSQLDGRTISARIDYGPRTKTSRKYTEDDAADYNRDVY